MKKALLVLLIVLALPGLALATRPDTEILRSYLQGGAPVWREPLDPAPTVGEVRTFHVWDMSQMPPDEKDISATCRGVSDNGYVFVEDEQWGVAMNQDAILTAWDTATPPQSIDPTEGIYDIETNLFGGLLDVDGWPGAVLLYYNMGCFNGQCFDGFFRSLDLTESPGSNHMDMLHLDAVNSDPGGDYMLGITAHELNHMIQNFEDDLEELWLQEALAEAAMVVVGYNIDTDWLNDFVQNPSTTFWDDGMTVHYGAALLMGTYFYEVGGIDLLQAISTDTAHGVTSIEAQLQSLGLGDSFEVFFGDLTTATAADYFWDAKGGDNPFRFDLLDVGELNWTAETEPGFEVQTLTLDVPAGAMLAYRFDLDSANRVDVQLPEYEADSLQVGAIGIGEEVVVERRGVSSSDWPNLTIYLSDFSTAILVFANPTNTELNVEATVVFSAAPVDDDTTDDDDDDDDDDGGDDDDASSGGDDDDDDSGCGC